MRSSWNQIDFIACSCCSSCNCILRLFCWVIGLKIYLISRYIFQITWLNLKFPTSFVLQIILQLSKCNLCLHLSLLILKLFKILRRFNVYYFSRLFLWRITIPLFRSNKRRLFNKKFDFIIKKMILDFFIISLLLSDIADFK